ncbi:MAG: DivIVA domain-containing protein [Ruminococcus sp.]|nr:DivIVA domain-containing protein [Ruminococcus sp.]
MLTIEEIKNISFRKATLSGGYRAEDVDNFIDEVIASFEQLKKEKAELVRKIDLLATRVQQYRDDEDTVRNALLASQKVSDACIREAKEKANKIVREAESKAQTILYDANTLTVTEKDNYLQLKADAATLRQELIELYTRHIKAIDDLPTADELEQAKAEINEKYPSADVPETVDEAKFTAVKISDKDDEAVDEVLASLEKNNVEVIETPAEPEIPQNVAVQQNAAAPKRSNRFAHLKFGENYDVSAE